MFSVALLSVQLSCFYLFIYSFFIHVVQHNSYIVTIIMDAYDLHLITNFVIRHV